MPLLEAVIEQGSTYDCVEALVGGGATIVEFDDLSSDVSELNVRAARRRLSNLGVSVAASDVGGQRGPAVAFDTASGAVRVTRAGTSTETL